VNPVAIEPGRYTVILEPTAVANLVQLISGAVNARGADEGRSFFSKAGGGNKIGEKVVDERVTLVSDPLDPRVPANTFGGDGMPNAEGDLDRERRGEEPRVRPLLGAEDGQGAGERGRHARDAGRDEVDGGDRWPGPSAASS
jgi:hypothetical protein